jgi:hypothetical protein
MAAEITEIMMMTSGRFFAPTFICYIKLCLKK